MMTFVVACGKSAEEQRAATMAAIQPCLAAGVDIDRCTQAYNGRAPGDSTNWLGLATAAMAGAALNHAISNRPQAAQQYVPTYSSATVPRVTPQVQPVTQTPVQVAPVLNKSVIIPDQKAQPLFVPNVVAKSLTPSVVAPAKTVSTFKPASASTFKPSVTKRK
jgi:hypothetical protein